MASSSDPYEDQELEDRYDECCEIIRSELRRHRNLRDGEQVPGLFIKYQLKERTLRDLRVPVTLPYDNNYKQIVNALSKQNATLSDPRGSVVYLHVFTQRDRSFETKIWGVTLLGFCFFAYAWFIYFGTNFGGHRIFVA